MEDKLSPIIVCGCQRSGTTALVRILNENGIMLTNEWGVFAWPSWREKFSLSEWIGNKDIVVGNNLWFQLYGYKIDHKKAYGAHDFASALHAVYDNRDRWTWGDKWSDYVFLIPEIKSYFPNAKVIYIYRDGRDVARSILRKGMRENLEDAFFIWESSINAWRSWAAEVDHIAICQEDMLRNPEEICRRIAAYCRVTQPKFEEINKVVLGAGEASKADYLASDRFSHLGAYTDMFSEDEIPSRVKALLSELGYEAHQPV